MIKYLKLFILILLPAFYFAENPVVFNNKNEIINIKGSDIKTLEDKKNTLPFSFIVSSNDFVINTKSIPNFGVSKSSFWLKFEIKNASINSHLLLNIAYPNLDEVELYTISFDQKWSVMKMGKNRPFYQRNYQNPGYIFDLIIPYNKSEICFLKVKSGGQIMTPIYLGVSKKVLETVNTENLFIGIYCGIFSIMFFYNLFIFYAVRDKVYLFYVGYILIVGLVQLCLLGYTFQFFWPDSPWLATHSVYLLSALVGISSIEFIKVFLRTKKHTPLLHKGFFILTFIYISYIILDFFNLGAELYHVIQLCALVLSLYMIFIAVKIAKKGFRPARFFLLAWSFFLSGVFIYALKDIGILPYNNFTLYSMPIGSAFETVLLSFALADRINILKKEKEQSQASTLLALRENEKLITEQNIVLEQKVGERTLELRDTNDELHITLYNLKNTQTQLVNAEKMASLGQLTAGIAHEINNPINFVSANVKPLKMDIDDLLSLINKYETITPHETTVHQFKEIEAFRKEIDIDYLKKEMEALLLGIEDGAKRTAEIVSGLKNFSRLDESEIKEANINEGIESTLILLKSAVPQNTEVITHLGKIPVIECLPGKLNQVFMNLFSNALYAISHQKSNEINKLIITSYLYDEHVCVSIEDTGIGMTPEVKAKIFDPFFTTKDVGEGTGLGMSIVFKIIESHGAKIEVESEFGIGTKILLILNKKITAS
jgi:signal transduction histidine kinase